MLVIALNIFNLHIRNILLINFNHNYFLLGYYYHSLKHDINEIISENCNYCLKYSVPKHNVGS